MRPTQYLIRFVVFTCIVLDPSGTGGGWGIVIGATLGVIISIVATGTVPLLASICTLLTRY